MASETFMKEPICLIQNTSKGGLQVNPKAVKILEGITQPVVVVAIVGLYRTGKSYLMNALAGKRNGFELGSTIQSHTKGIWMWCVPHPGKRNCTLVLLDTEGLGDVEKGNSKHDTWVFAMAVLLSSTLVYNSVGTIDQDAVDKLHFVSELTEHIKVKALQKEEEAVKMNSADDIEYVSFFPNFIWVVRDFKLKLEIDGKQVTEDEYLERALKLKRGQTKEVMQYNLPRQCIRDYFPTRKCFVLITPVNDGDLARLDSLPDSALRPQFLKQSNQFCQYVLQVSKVKMVKGGHRINGRMFSMLAKSYVETISSGKVPCLENAVTILATTENEAAAREALAYYVTQMKKRIMYPAELNVLSEAHGNCEKAALQVFMQRSFKDEGQKYQKQLAAEINKHYETLLRKNKTISQRICQDLLFKLSADVEKKLRDGVYMRPGGHGMYVKDQKQVVEIFQRTPNKGVMADQMLEQFMDRKKGEKASILRADKMLSDVERKLKDEQARVERLEQQRKAEEERRKQLEQWLRDLEHSYRENISHLEAKKKEESAKLKQETEGAMECKLKEQERLIQQGFTERAKDLEEEIEMLQKQRNKQEQKMEKDYEGLKDMAEELLLQCTESKKAQATFEKKMRADSQKSLEDKQARVERLEQQRKAEEERRKQLEQQLRDLEHSYRENISHLEAKMKEESAKLKQETEGAMECKLKEQERLIQQGFTERAKDLEEEIEMLQKQRNKQEQKMEKDYEDLKEMTEKLLMQCMESKKAQATFEKKMRADPQKRLENERARVERLKQRHKGEKERRKQLEQRLRDLEHSYRENISHLEAKMKEESAKLKQETEGAMECKLKAQERLIQQGFTERAKDLEEEIEMLQKQRNKQEQKMEKDYKDMKEMTEELLMQCMESKKAEVTSDKKMQADSQKRLEAPGSVMRRTSGPSRRRKGRKREGVSCSEPGQILH